MICHIRKDTGTTLAKNQLGNRVSLNPLRILDVQVRERANTQCCADQMHEQ